jgi:AcrR family transcriptional regulator
VNRKIEQGLRTRDRIVRKAKNLFAKHGYGGVSIEDVLAACRLSRGALYHHFASKEALFEAVFEAMEIEIAERVVARSSLARGAANALRIGCEAFLDLTNDSAVRQIVLIDAPSVLGWEKWREIDARHGFGLLKRSLVEVSRGGAVPPNLVHGFAHVLLASLSEVAMLAARADDRSAALSEGKMVVRTLLTRLLGGSGEAPPLVDEGGKHQR